MQKHGTNGSEESQGRIRCAVLLSGRQEITKDKEDNSTSSRAGYIQISPTRDGPWTTVRLNYAAPAACWRFGTDVIASEVSLEDGNTYVNIRSLVSVTNNTDIVIELRLKGKCRTESPRQVNGKQIVYAESDDTRIETDEFFETEIYIPSSGWVACPSGIPSDNQLKELHKNSEQRVRSFIQFFFFFLQ